MTYYPDTTLLPPSLFPSNEIDKMILDLWTRHLEFELSKDVDPIIIKQHLEVTTAIIDYWEKTLIGIYENEIRKRRSDSNKNPE